MLDIEDELDINIEEDEDEPSDEEIDAVIKEILRDATAYMSNDAHKYTLLTADEEVALAKRIEGGDESAKVKLIESNQKWAIVYAKQWQGHGLDLPDLVQEATIGLRKAAEKFDYRKGYKFSTYATRWMMQKITRAIAEMGHPYRIPDWFAVLVYKIRKVINESDQELSPEELNTKLNDPEISLKNVVLALNFIENSLARSLDIKASNEGRGDALLDTIEDETADDPEKEAMESQLGQKVRAAIAELKSPKQREILLKRFGLYDGDERTLFEIGRGMDITRERVRQLQNKALKEIKNTKAGRELRELL